MWRPRLHRFTSPCGQQSRRDQAVIVIIQTTQDAIWTASLNLVSSLPENASAEHVRAQGDAMERALFELGIRLEPVGYMAFPGLVSLQTVDHLIGGVWIVIWLRARAWTDDYRK